MNIKIHKPLPKPIIALLHNTRITHTLVNNPEVIEISTLNGLPKLPIELVTYLESTGLRLVVTNLPTTHLNYKNHSMVDTINELILDTLKSKVGLTKEQKRNNIRDGQERAKKNNPNYNNGGRKPNLEMHQEILKYLRYGLNAEEVAQKVGCGVSTVYRVKRG